MHAEGTGGEKPTIPAVDSFRRASTCQEEYLVENKEYFSQRGLI